MREKLTRAGKQKIKKILQKWGRGRKNIPASVDDNKMKFARIQGGKKRQGVGTLRTPMRATLEMTTRMQLQCLPTAIVACYYPATGNKNHRRRRCHFIFFPFF